jgi:polysaccharide biosynthesis transport protein
MPSIRRPSTIPPSLRPDTVAISGGVEGEDLSFRQAVQVVRRRKRIILLVTFAVGALVLIVSLILRPYYSSVSTIEIEKQQNDALDSALGQLASIGGTDDTKTEIQTEVSVLESDALAIETMERVHFEDHQKEGWKFFRDADRKLEEQGLPLIDAPIARERLLRKFSKRLAVAPIEETRLVQITFEDHDPRFAADVTNALISQYVHDKLGRRNSSTLQATEWMTQQISDLNRQVEAAQQKLIDYERKSGLIVYPGAQSTTANQSGSTPASVSSPVLNRLLQLNQDLVTAKEARITREGIFRLAKAGNVDALSNIAEAQISSMSTISTGLAPAGMFGGLATLRQQQGALKLQIASTLQSYGAKNPHLVDLSNQVAEVDRQIRDEVRRIVSRAELDYEMAQKAEDGIQRAYDNEAREAYKINDAQIRLAVLQQEADSTRILYEDLYTKLEESKLSIGMQPSNIAIIGGGLRPARPKHPNVPLNTCAGIAAGLFLGVVSAFIRDHLDDSIMTAEQAEELTGISVLGLIPLFEDLPTSSKNGASPPAEGVPKAEPGAWAVTSPRSKATEAYRGLRTTLLLSKADAPPRTVLITSALPGEGKSTTAYNLAASFAVLGSRVLVIDADFRKPSLHKLADITNKVGLTNLLTSHRNPDEVIVSDEAVENLYILASGPIPPNPAELLGSVAFSKLMGFFSEKYELVIIDCPPTLLVADSAIISALVDGVVMVIRSRVTTRRALARAAEQLQRSNANLIGFVLNAVDTDSAEYYYAYGYYGGDYYRKEDQNGDNKS